MAMKARKKSKVPPSLNLLRITNAHTRRHVSAAICRNGSATIALVCRICQRLEQLERAVPCGIGLAGAREISG